MKKISYFLELFNQILKYLATNNLAELSNLIQSTETIQTFQKYKYNNFYDTLSDIDEYICPIPGNTITRENIVSQIESIILEFTEIYEAQGDITLIPTPAKHSLYFDDFTGHDSSINDYRYFMIIKGLEFMSSDQLTDLYKVTTGTQVAPDPANPHRDMVLKCLSDIPLQTLLEKFPAK